MEKAAVGVVLLALLVLPAPLIPPHRLAEAAQSLLGIGWKAAYLVATIGLHVVVYGFLGIVAAFAAPRASTLRERALRLVVVPLVLIALTVVVRSAKLGHVPVLANAAVPLISSLLGVGTGLLLRQRGWWVTLPTISIALGGWLWVLLPGASSALSRDVEAHVRRLVASTPALATDEARFGAVVQAAFTPLPGASPQMSATDQNRAALLALGIAIGHEQLARLAGVTPWNELAGEAAALRLGTTLGGREDWARHFCLSAALTLLENPFLSDASGLLKEELDALARGTGFSFGDLAADRAGVRFAEAATASEEAARAMQARLAGGFVAHDFFPSVSDLPEDLTVEQFRRDYGGVGDPRYRLKVRELESRLDACAGLRR